MTERQSTAYQGPVWRANLSKDTNAPMVDGGRSPKCVRDYPGSESDPEDWAENKDIFRAKKFQKYHEGERAKARERMTLRRARCKVLERARQLKSLLNVTTRKKVEAHTAQWKRRVLHNFFDSRCLALERKRMSEREMLTKFATSRDLNKIVIMVAEYEISIIEGIAEHGSVENYLGRLGMASEILTKKDEDMENAKPDASNYVQVFGGKSDEVLAQGCVDQRTDSISTKYTRKVSSCPDITTDSMHAADQCCRDDEGTNGGHGTENAGNKLCGSDKTEVQTSTGGSGEAMEDIDADGLLRMDIQPVDVETNSGVECFRASGFSW